MSLKGLKKLRQLALIAITISVVSLSVSAYFNQGVWIIITGIFCVLSIVFHLSIKVITPFVMDKILDIEALKQQGLTIVNCPRCHKKNVLEDHYCIYCQTPLGD